MQLQMKKSKERRTVSTPRKNIHRRLLSTICSVPKLANSLIIGFCLFRFLSQHFQTKASQNNEKQQHKTSDKETDKWNKYKAKSHFNCYN